MLANTFLHGLCEIRLSILALGLKQNDAAIFSSDGSGPYTDSILEVPRLLFGLW